MTYKEKIKMLAELMDVKEDEISADTELTDIEDYDSMTKISLIVLMKDEFGVELSAKEVKAFETVGDILSRMQ